jgi:hypothetical protein
MSFYGLKDATKDIDYKESRAGLSESDFLTLWQRLLSLGKFSKQLQFCLAKNVLCKIKILFKSFKNLKYF